MILAVTFAVAGCASAPSPSGSTAAHVFAVDGRYQLTFEVQDDSPRAGDAIAGTAMLTTADGKGTDLAGSGSGLINFEYKALDGSHDIEPTLSADCAAYRLDDGKPISTPLKKSGGYGETQPDAGFYLSFFADRLVHLPPGDWDVSAIADFIDGLGCTGATHQFRATVHLHVTP